MEWVSGQGHSWTDLLEILTVTSETPGHGDAGTQCPSDSPAPVLTFFSLPLLPAPCCPSDINPVLVSSDRVEIVWSPVRGAELYETKTVDGFNVVECNDTAPACTLSALECDTKYNITVYSFSEVRGSNTSCTSQFITTGMVQQGFCSPMSGWLTSMSLRKGIQEVGKMVNCH